MLVAENGSKLVPSSSRRAGCPGLSHLVSRLDPWQSTADRSS